MYRILSRTRNVVNVRFHESPNYIEIARRAAVIHSEYIHFHGYQETARVAVRECVEQEAVCSNATQTLVPTPSRHRDPAPQEDSQHKTTERELSAIAQQQVRLRAVRILRERIREAIFQ